MGLSLHGVVYGGVGSGLYGMLVLAILTVFVAGLMVGRTPEYLRKKIRAREIKLVALYILTMPLIVLAALSLVSAFIQMPAHRRAEVIRIPRRIGDQVVAPVVENPAVGIREAVGRAASLPAVRVGRGAAHPTGRRGTIDLRDHGPNSSN